MNHRPTVTIEPDEFGRTLMSNGQAVGKVMAVPPGGWQKPVNGSHSQRWRAIFFARYSLPVIAAERQKDLIIEAAKHLAGEYRTPETEDAAIKRAAQRAKQRREAS